MSDKNKVFRCDAHVGLAILLQQIATQTEVLARNNEAGCVVQGIHVGKEVDID